MEDLIFDNLTKEYCAEVSAIENGSIDDPWTLEQIMGLVGDSKAIARVGLLKGKVVCYYSFYNVCNEGNINNLAVCVDFRGKGFGSRLIEDMICVARSMSLDGLTLEVNVNNIVAISLYEKFGFKVEGRRIKFYSGKDDALIMWKRNL